MKKKAYADSSADLLIRHQKKSRLLLPLLFFFFFNLLQWRFERVWSYSMNLVSSQDQIQSPFKGKSKQQPSNKRVGNRSVARNNRSNRGGEGTPRSVAPTTVHGGHHGWTVVPTGRAAPLRPSYDASCLPPWTVGCLSWAICIGFLGLFASSLA